MAKRVLTLKSLIAPAFFFFSLAILNFSLPTHAASAFDILSGRQGIVPCGTSYSGNKACTVCDFFVLIQNIINVLTFLAISMGTVAALVIGIRFLLFGSSPKMIQQTKQQFGWLVWGIVVVLCSWIFLNTLFNFVANKSLNPWNSIICSVTVTTPSNISVGGTNGGTTSSVAPCANAAAPTTGGTFQGGGGQFGGGGAGGSWEGGTIPSCLDSSGYSDGVDNTTQSYKDYASTPPEGNGLTTAEPGSADPNLYNKKIDGYVADANLNNVDSKRVKAIIQAESSGNPNAIHTDIDGKNSYGLMQIRPDTARLYDTSLQGLTDDQIGQKLTDPNYNINIGTQYYNNLYQKYNGDPTLASAVYNGGTRAVRSSVDCPDVSYAYQCQYDSTDHTVLNERPGHPGFGPTRRYVSNINTVYSQLSK